MIDTDSARRCDPYPCVEAGLAAAPRRVPLGCFTTLACELSRQRRIELTDLAQSIVAFLLLISERSAPVAGSHQDICPWQTWRPVRICSTRVSQMSAFGPFDAIGIVVSLRLASIRAALVPFPLGHLAPDAMPDHV